MIHTGWVFQEKLKGNECLSHDFRELLKIAGLTDELNATFKTNPAFVANWGTVEQWKVASRYESKSEAEARTLYAAITEEPNGVLRWIRNYW